MNVTDAAVPNAVLLVCGDVQVHQCSTSLLRGAGHRKDPAAGAASALRSAAAAAMLLIDEQLPELPTILKNSIVTAEDSALAAAAAPSLRGALGEALQALGGAEVPSEKLERMVLHADTSAAQDAACKVLTSQCSGRAARAATLAVALVNPFALDLVLRHPCEDNKFLTNWCHLLGRHGCLLDRWKASALGPKAT